MVNASGAPPVDLSEPGSVACPGLNLTVRCADRIAEFGSRCPGRGLGRVLSPTPIIAWNGGLVSWRTGMSQDFRDAWNVVEELVTERAQRPKMI